MSKSAEKPTQLKISTDISREDRKVQEICVSPSWSDHGEKAMKKERRRAEKAHKEREKKIRADEEHQRSADLKAGKRLSKKPPPAAMETQKMPTALRRGSWLSMLSSQPSSGENSRRSSREENRASEMSIGSIKSKRSQSTPAISTELAPATAGASEHWHTIVSPSAPKLPSFRWSSSRRASNDGRKSASPKGEETYEKDFIAFAYRLEPSEMTSTSEKIDPENTKNNLKGEGPPSVLPGAPTLSRSATEPSFMSVPYESTPGSSSPSTPKIERDSIESGKVVQSAKSPSGEPPHGLVATSSLPSTEVIPQAQTKPPHDGSSYVHKQRMYQQQQSIAGFEDQQAIKDATELANERTAEVEAFLDERTEMATERGHQSESAPSFKVSQAPKATKSHVKDASICSVYTKQRHRSESPHVALAPINPTSTESAPLSQCTTLDQPPSEGKEESRARASSQSPQKTLAASKLQVSAALKSDKILGFRRRSKEPAALVSVPCDAESHVKASSDHTTDVQPTKEPVVKRSKIERLFREPKPPFGNRERRSSSDSKSKEGSSDGRVRQSHSRTRTSSSTVLNDFTALPLPRSTTEPVLKTTKKSAEQAKNTKHQRSTEDKHAKSEAKAQKSDRPQPSAATEPTSDLKSSVKNKPHVKATGDSIKSSGDAFENTAIKKQAHEVIVESETGEGLIRKTSITRPRSNPHLQTKTIATNGLPTHDFLPPLKHQPLIKKDSQSPTRPTPTDTTSVSISQFQDPITPLAYESPHAPDLKLIPRSPLRPSQFPAPISNRPTRSSTDVATAPFNKNTSADGVAAKPVAKLFVICCKCKFWHDLPSKLYEAMALPLELHKAENGKIAGARLETAVKCPWCEHAMTTGCCQGWTTVVYLHERHH